jgi:short-subunit dehydrogenase
MSQSTRQTALITGASGGIGLEFARIFAREGYNLVLVARTEKALNDLAADLRAKYGIDVRVFAKDLSHPAAPRELYDEVEKAGIAVDVLVNNAGFASYGPFAEIDLQKELEEIQVNVVTLTHLSKLFIRPMLVRRRGKILNVASTAAFQPGPLMAVYYATKAYVLSLSEAIAEEVRGQGITVTALCPGPTESGFQKRADMQESKLVQGGLMSAAGVAEAGYKALMDGQTVVVPGLFNKVGTLLPRFVPRRMATRIVMNMQARVGH